jgi:XTP/dITP diphosphohydrolase
LINRPRTLLIATRNPGKFAEIEAVLGDLPLKLSSLLDYPDVPDIEEDQATFLDNAIKKAAHYAALSGLMTLADDSGLEVDCLGGAPGIYSARFAGEHKDDRANNRKLVSLLRRVPLPERSARFRCAIALADPGGILATASGSVEGLIIDEPRGRRGFGYDPHFLLPGLNLTTAELNPAHKNRISHRGQALRRIRSDLARLI